MRLPVEDQDDSRTCIGCGSCSRHCPRASTFPNIWKK
ncbi:MULTISPECIES: 4Fe-4S binding protein [Blautia]|nr:MULTISPECIES: 4Fe-4S binding protein [Blautia]